MFDLFLGASTPCGKATDEGSNAFRPGLRESNEKDDEGRAELLDGERRGVFVYELNKPTDEALA